MFIRWTLMLLGLMTPGIALHARQIPANSQAAEFLPPASMRVVVEGTWQPSPEKAYEDALDQAMLRIRVLLEHQSPPIRSQPSRELIRSIDINPDREARMEWFMPPISSNMYKQSIEFELTPEMLRNLRAKDRVYTGLIMIASAFMVVLCIVGLWKINDWTLGYLSGSLRAAGFLAILVILVLSLLTH